jgi:hypothetical protein
MTPDDKLRNFSVMGFLLLLALSIAILAQYIK